MKKAVIISLVLFAGGCVNTSAIKPTTRDSRSIIETIDLYYQASERGLIDPGKLFGGSGAANRDGVRVYRKWWCLDDSSSKRELRSLVEGHCRAQSGTFVNDWCSSKTSERPIYKVLIGGAGLIKPRGNVPYCTAGEHVGVIAFDKQPGIKSDRWLQIARSRLQYQKPSTLRNLAAQKRQIEYRKAEAQATKLEHDAQAVLASNRGTKICKVTDGGKYTYVGFIEDRTAKKIKVSVISAILTRNPSLSQGGFKPVTMWDYPIGWYICE